jgi:hypothetical protein
LLNARRGGIANKFDANAERAIGGIAVLVELLKGLRVAPECLLTVS